jgi:hypothetical protein
MENVIVLLVVAVIIAVAVLYIYREKKKGSKCIGCPHAKSCPSAANGGCGCGTKKR